MILVVAAHPDDEVLGCGAMLAKLSQTEPVHIKLMGIGRGFLNGAAEAAGKLLGASSVELGSQWFSDNAFDNNPLLDLVHSVEEVIARLKPNTIYTHHAGDLNVDHRLTFQAVLTACRPMASCSVKNIYSFEVPSATDWAFQQFQPWTPTRFVNVADTLERKIEALACYTSEARDFPHPRSPEAIRARATWWGAVVGCQAAEAFQVVRELR